jgi:hypothetical protein
MGRGVGFYAPTATLALLAYLHRRCSDVGRFLLVETAHGIGELGLEGSIGIRSQAKAAGISITAAMATLEENLDADPDELAALSERADDPEEDYQLLLGKTQRLLFDVVEERGDGGNVFVPGWMAWRVCREVAVIHYDLEDDEFVRLKASGADDEEDGEYDRYLERLVDAHGLAAIVDRLHSDCFSQDPD